MSLLDALKERIELAEGMIRRTPVQVFNLRLASDSALADLMINGEVYRDQPYTVRQFFVSSKRRQLTMN